MERLTSFEMSSVTLTNNISGRRTAISGRGRIGRYKLCSYMVKGVWGRSSPTLRGCSANRSERRRGTCPPTCARKGSGRKSAKTAFGYRRSRFSYGRGFTLFEVMVVVFIFSIVLAATYSVLTIARTSYHAGEVKVTLQQEVRKAMDRITAELREASSVNLGDEYPFTVWGERVKYEVVSGQLQRVVQGGSPTVVANDVGSLQFSLSGGDMVYITLTTQKTTIFGRPVTATLTSKVGLRN